MKRTWAWLGVLAGFLSSLAGLAGTVCITCGPVCGVVCGTACATGAGYVITGILGLSLATFFQKYSVWLIGLGILFVARGIFLILRREPMKVQFAQKRSFRGVRKPKKTDEGVEECCGNVLSKEETVFRPVSRLGVIATSKGEIPVISSDWSFADATGAIAVRLNFDRMNYAVAPGLYALGKPLPASPVFVSANYKLSFDILRRELKGLDSWLLVLDTNGINVWCAAGKGTFGTGELVKRIADTGLSKIVTTRKLIVPQLGAPGIEAHKVQQRSGFSVIYGPVQAQDIPTFLSAGCQATPEMRKVTFPALERFTVSVMEVALVLKKGLFITGLFLMGTLAWSAPAYSNAGRPFLVLAGVFWAAILTGTVLHAVLLPVLPGRAFSVRGGFLGLAVASLISILGNSTGVFPHSFSTSICMALLFSALSAYLALNFTGASTFTSHTGVKKEVEWALPIIYAAMVIPVLFQILSFFGRVV